MKGVGRADAAELAETKQISKGLAETNRWGQVPPCPTWINQRPNGPGAKDARRFLSHQWQCVLKDRGFLPSLIAV